MVVVCSLFFVPSSGAVALQRLGTVDLGILAESTPLVWRDELWLFECIQGGRYYDNINRTSYPDAPQPPGFLRFTNPRTGERSAPFGHGYGLGNALVVDGRLFVFATAVPWGISGNNTVVSVFWSDDMASWDTAVALRTDQPHLFPRNASVIARKLWNTSVRPVPPGAGGAGGAGVAACGGVHLVGHHDGLREQEARAVPRRLILSPPARLCPFSAPRCSSSSRAWEETAFPTRATSSSRRRSLRTMKTRRPQRRRGTSSATSSKRSPSDGTGCSRTKSWARPVSSCLPPASPPPAARPCCCARPIPALA